MLYRVLSFVAVLTFSISENVNAHGAGVLPMFDDGTVLIGKEYRRAKNGKPAFTTWSDFGGGPDRGETIAKTAYREFKEETAHYTFPQVTLSMVHNSPHVDHHHWSGQSYRMYLVHVPGQKPSISTFHNNKRIKSKHVEKMHWKYVSAKQLAQNAWGHPAMVPGLNETLYGPFVACLKKSKAQSTLSNWTARPTAKPTAPTKPKATMKKVPTVAKPALSPVSSSKKRAVKPKAKVVQTRVAKKVVRKPAQRKIVQKASHRKKVRRPVGRNNFRNAFLRKAVRGGVGKNNSRKALARKNGRRVGAKNNFRKALVRKNFRRPAPRNNSRKAIARKNFHGPVARKNFRQAIARKNSRRLVARNSLRKPFARHNVRKSAPRKNVSARRMQPSRRIAPQQKRLTKVRAKNARQTLGKKRH